MSLTDYRACAWCGLQVDVDLQMHPGCLRLANTGVDPESKALNQSVVEKKGR